MSVPNSLGLVCSPVTTHGLIFDMDGVLFDSHPIHRRAWRQLFEKAGLDVDDKALDFILDGAKREEILEHFLGPLPPEKMAMYAAEKDNILKSQEGDLQTTEGLEVFLDSLESAAIPKAVATSATKLRTTRLLQTYGLTERFRAVVTGDDVRSGKTNPEIFLRTAEALGVSPSDILVFEDAVPAIRVAKRAGMKCIGMASGIRASQLLAAGAEMVISNFNEVSVTAVLEVLCRNPNP